MTPTPRPAPTPTGRKDARAPTGAAPASAPPITAVPFKPRRGWFVLTLVALVLWVAALIAMYVTTVAGRPGTDSPVTQRSAH